MSVPLKLTTYICNGLCTSSIKVNQQSPASISTSPHEDGHLTVNVPLQGIVTECATQPFIEVDVEIIKVDADFLLCFLLENPDVLFYNYNILFDRITSIDIQFKNPKNTCSWEYSLLQSFFYGPRTQTFPGPGPIQDSKQATYPFGDILVYTNTKDIRIGEDLSLSWKIKDHPQTVARSVWYHGRNITGGRITSILQEEESKERNYLVSVAGLLVTIRSSDFYPYQVDDWVSIIFVSNKDEGDPPVLKQSDFEGKDVLLVPLIAW